MRKTKTIFFIFLRASAPLWLNKGVNMQKWVCQVCDCIYDPAVGDPDNGVKPGTKFEDLPDDLVCPECGVGKDQFELFE